MYVYIYLDSNIELCMLRLVQLNCMMNCSALSSIFLADEQVCGFVFLFFSLFAFNIELWSVLIQLHQLGKIELRFLEKLNFSYNNVLEGENLAGILHDLFANSISSPIIVAV